MTNIALIVLDSVGIGALPDAAEYGDKDAATLQHICENVPKIEWPNLENLGLGKIDDLKGLSSSTQVKGAHGKLDSQTIGKDTTTGHWELMGIVLDKALKTFPDGFPPEITEEFKKLTGHDFIGNYPSSGTEIIKKLGKEHQETKKLIVYTSADSVLQIAAHEETIPLEELYRVCEITRGICEKQNIARAIARPFIDENGAYVRTKNRKDFSIPPPGKTALNYLQDAGIETIGIGKIDDIFAGSGLTQKIHSKGNPACIRSTIEALRSNSGSFIFINLVDFDMLYGHRRDVNGYYQCIKDFDQALPDIIEALNDEDIMMITADHGCDPCFTGTDHTREYAPLLVYSKHLSHEIDLGTRESYADVGKTITDFFKTEAPIPGESFLKSILGVK